MENDARPRALLLAPEAPYPLAGGGALRCASLLEYLGRRYALHLIVFRQPGAADPGAVLPSGLVRRVTILELPFHRRNRAARAWRNASRMARRIPPLMDRFAGFEREVRHAVAGQSFELGVIEHFWCAPYLDAISGVCRHTVMDLHNIESVLHARCANVDRTAAASAHRVFARASRQLEQMWLPRFTSVLAASETDAEVIRSIAPGARVSVYPNALPCAPAKDIAAERSGNVLVFSGNLEFHPNISAVRFFRAEVWPKLRAAWPGLIWRLVGKNPEAVRPVVEGDSRIEMSGPVENSVAELERATIAVVPLLAGSGTRLKILEAWAAGLPVVSTTIGAEGLPVRNGEHLLLADDAADFGTAISRLLACTDLRRELAANGRLLLEKEFTWEQAWRKLHF